MKKFRQLWLVATVMFSGGIGLYNNAFSCGFIAAGIMLMVLAIAEALVALG